MRRRLLWWLKLAVALTLLGYLLQRVGLQDLARTLRQAAPGWLLAGTAAIALGFALNGLSLQVLVRQARRGSIDARHYYAAFFHSSFLAFWLPGRVGDFSIAYMMREHIPMEDSVVYVLIDKLITLTVMLAAAGAGIAYFLNPPGHYWTAAAGIGLGGATVLWLTHAPALALARRHLPEALRERLRPVWQTSLHFATHRRGPLLVNTAITLARLLVVGVSVVLMLRAFGEQVSVLEGVLSVGAVQLLSLLPISIQGLGVMEGAYLLLLSPRGVSEAGILLFCLAGRVLSILVVFALHLGFVLSDKGKSKPSRNL